MERRATKTPAALDLDAALAGIAAMNVEQLSGLWRHKRGLEPPAAFSNLITRLRQLEIRLRTNTEHYDLQRR